MRNWKLVLLATLLSAMPAYPLRRAGLPPPPRFVSGSGKLSAAQERRTAADQSTEALIAKIMSFAGLPQNFTVQPYDRFNVQAEIINNKRVILYNTAYLDGVNESANTTWGAAGILAHEIAHHILGHQVEYTETNHELELAADDYAGFILGKMGATLKEAQSGFEVTSSEVVSPNSAHPKKSLRLAAVEKGWTRARNLPDPGRASPVVSESLTGPLSQVLAGTRDNFFSIRGPAVVTQSTEPAFKSNLIPPPFQNWQIVIGSTGDSWYWTARSPSNPDKQQAERDVNAINSAFRSLLPQDAWILANNYEDGDRKLSRWWEVGTGAFVEVGLRRRDGSLSVQVRSRRVAYAPNEPEYKSRLRALVASARRGFPGITETRLQDPSSGLLPPDAYRDFLAMISLTRTGRSTSLSWETDQEMPQLARARYGVILRTVAELFPSFQETDGPGRDEKRFRDGRVEIRVALEKESGDGWVRVNIWDWGQN